MKWRQLITDPSSGQLSMSRLSFGVLVLAVLFVCVGLALGLKNLEKVSDLLKSALLTTAGLYGANSVAGAVARSGTPPAETPNPQPPSAGPVG